MKFDTEDLSLVIRREVVIGSHHTPGDGLPGRHGGPVVDTEDERVPVPLTKWMAGSYITFIDSDPSLHVDKSQD